MYCAAYPTTGSSSSPRQNIAAVNRSEATKNSLSLAEIDQEDRFTNQRCFEQLLVVYYQSE